MFTVIDRGGRDIFRLAQENAGKRDTAVCVTTNGVRKKDGRAVMGKGIALQADRMFGLSKDLGEKLHYYGNIPFHMGWYSLAAGSEPFAVITFPTKDDWREDSKLPLIMQSAQILRDMCTREKITHVWMTPPGCGCGNLDFASQVRPLLEDILGADNNTKYTVLL